MRGGEVWRVVLRLTAAVIALWVCPQPASAAAAVLTGVADQRTSFFDAPTYRGLELDTVRLVVPWDAGASPGPWDAWIARATREGAQILIALQHANGSACPDAPCVMPSQDAYRTALAALLAKHPSITQITAWNEPNDRAQPTRQRPDVAAAYHDIARDLCPACVVVAGDLLDDPSLPGYLASYKAALRSPAMVWGLHNYLDAAYFKSTGVDTMLRETSGPLWLTETGGIVRLTFADGDLLSYDEERAADSMAWLYGLAAARPRIERMYLYQWLAARDSHWDSGLIGLDGKARAAYSVVAEQVGPRGGREASAGAAARAAAHRRGATATLRFGRRLRLLAGGRLEIAARCIVRGLAVRRCRQHLVVRVAHRRVAELTVDVAAGRMFRRVVRLASWARTRLVHGRSRRVALFTRTLGGRRNVDRGTIAVTKMLRSGVPKRR